MKKLMLATAIALAPVSAIADVIQATVTDSRLRTVPVTNYTNELRCETRDVPIYSRINPRAGENALLGMIIGGAIGDAISGGDGGTTAGGAIIGGIVGADRGASDQIVGYERREFCNNVSIPVTTYNTYYQIYWRSGRQSGNFNNSTDIPVGTEIYIQR